MNKFSSAIASLVLIGAAAAAHAELRVDLLGDAVPASEATRTINITPATRYVNVTEGETVKFVANGAAFAFKFDGPHAMAFDLQRIAPAGALRHAVTAYVAPNPEEGGGGD
jgi:hypothetical protein